MIRCRVIRMKFMQMWLIRMKIHANEAHSHECGDIRIASFVPNLIRMMASFVQLIRMNENTFARMNHIRMRYYSHTGLIRMIHSYE